MKIIFSKFILITGIVAISIIPLFIFIKAIEHIYYNPEWLLAIGFLIFGFLFMWALNIYEEEKRREYYYECPICNANVYKKDVKGDYTLCRNNHKFSVKTAKLDYYKRNDIFG